MPGGKVVNRETAGRGNLYWIGAWLHIWAVGTQDPARQLIIFKRHQRSHWYP